MSASAPGIHASNLHDFPFPQSSSYFQPVRSSTIARFSGVGAVPGCFLKRSISSMSTVCVSRLSLKRRLHEEAEDHEPEASDQHDRHRGVHHVHRLDLDAANESARIEDRAHGKHHRGLQQLADESHDARERAFAPPARHDFIDVGHVVVDAPRNEVQRAAPEAGDDRDSQEPARYRPRPRSRAWRTRGCRG